MATHHLLVLDIFFFLTGLSGTQSVSTVSQVSVKRGGSITIPCLYGQIYRNHVKYWCRGSGWLSYSNVVRTDHPKTSGKTSISDDINQQMFTVTITKLSPSDSDYYWCIVEKECTDDGVGLQLSVTPDGTFVKLQQEQRKNTNGLVLTVKLTGLRMENTG
ncbi:unnamed protein product [Coregonus sp. 'balchen']|nr:unnamed protein product [Coregonus sp. 'balchen']